LEIVLAENLNTFFFFWFAVAAAFSTPRNFKKCFFSKYLDEDEVRKFGSKEKHHLVVILVALKKPTMLSKSNSNWSHFDIHFHLDFDFELTFLLFPYQRLLFWKRIEVFSI
jgi:hypothetical protein